MKKRRIVVAFLAVTLCLLTPYTTAFSAQFSSIIIQASGSIGAGGIRLVQGPAKGISTSSNISITLASPPTMGNTLIATIGVLSNTVVSSISEKGVTWTKQTGFSTGTYSQDVEIWLGTVYSGDVKSITITLAATPSWGAIADICEYSGILLGGFLDKATSNSGYTSMTDTGTVTTTQPNELLIGASFAWDLAQSSPTNGFTLLDGVLTTLGSGSASLAYLAKAVTSIGTANSGVSLSNSKMWVGCIATFFARGTIVGAGSSTNIFCGRLSNGTYFSDDGYYKLGSSSSTIINNAISEASSFGGGNVTLVNGTIILDASLVPQSNVYFKATGIAISQPTPTTLGNSISLMLTTAGGVNNFVLEGGTWNGNKGALSDHRTTATWSPNFFKYFGISLYGGATPYYNITIKNLLVENCIGQGIDLVGCQNGYIYNCTASNCGDNPITLDLGCSNCTVDYCTVVGGQDVGINTFHATNCTIENNNVANVTQYTGASHWGIAAENSQNINILNNNVTGCDYDIRDVSDCTLIQGNIVSNSIIGIQLNECTNATVRNNIFQGWFSYKTFDYYTPITQTKNCTLQGNVGLGAGWQSLNITLGGTGSGTVSQSNSWCNQGLASIIGNLWQFPTNSNVKLTATATSGSFVNYTFSNGTVVTTNPFTSNMDSDKSVTVNFNS